MVKLLATDIQTKEVLGWAGVHLFHAQMSSCSQKLRIYLNYKDITWASHPVPPGENNKLYYLGINPRGLVPTLIHDGAVHIESNDILLYLEDAFPKHRLVPTEYLGRIEGLLRHEDDLHMDLRIISFRFLWPPGKPPKTEKDLVAYANTGSGTVLGKADADKLREIRFYRWFLEGGIPDQAVKQAVTRFAAEFRNLDATLIRQPFLLGDTISVLDFAWLVYTHRLFISGYPLERAHPNLWRWYRGLAEVPKINSEIALPPEFVAPYQALRKEARAKSDTLEDVCGLS